MDGKLNVRTWFSLIVAGLMGQLAWAIENNYLNLYIFHTTKEYAYIPWMVAASAIVATITTLLMGALSDRLGKRKMFIWLGYILWGISIILFAFLDPTSSFNMVAGSAMASGIMIIVMDCIMTFFGSTANDAAFNAFVTDNTNSSNRGKAESVLSILPMIATIIIVLVGGPLVNNENPRWDIFFYIFGGLTVVVGIICIFLLPKDTKPANKEEPYIKNIFYGFRPSVIKANPLFYLVLLSYMIFSIAIQIFMPYLMVYIEQVLEITGGQFTLTFGVVLVVSCIITVLLGAFMDKIGKNKLIFPALAANILGTFLLFFVRSSVGVMICGTIMMTGFMVSTAILGAKLRDYTPPKETGLFQGVRMIFIVMIPMITGPYIGLGVSNINATKYVNEFGIEVLKPNAYIFLFGAIVLALTIIPVIFLLRKEKKLSNEAK